MRLGSRREGFAAARHGHAEERPRLDFARVHSVSPLRTLIVVGAFEPATRAADEAVTAGRTRCAPARIRLGSTMLGLTASSSCHRLPRPRFCCASFQSESPALTLIVRCVATG